MLQNDNRLGATLVAKIVSGYDNHLGALEICAGLLKFVSHNDNH